ncbi:MAG: hypothetical protein QF754_07125, partial [Alphaproteobacteria bacterium]|nr:hypothetical protein [Alphaproteobacteria bacterium]
MVRDHATVVKHAFACFLFAAFRARLDLPSAALARRDGKPHQQAVAACWLGKSDRQDFALA